MRGATRRSAGLRTCSLCSDAGSKKRSENHLRPTFCFGTLLPAYRQHAITPRRRTCPCWLHFDELWAVEVLSGGRGANGTDDALCQNPACNSLRGMPLDFFRAQSTLDTLGWTASNHCHVCSPVSGKAYLPHKNLICGTFPALAWWETKASERGRKKGR